MGAVGVAGLTLITTALHALDGALLRDASVYAYGGQQVLAGTPPYEGIVDPKGPMAVLGPAVGVATGRTFGLTDLGGIRVVFALALLAAVLGVYALALVVTRSVPGAVAAAVGSLGVDAWSRSAWEGPEVKVLAAALMVWCLWSLAEQRWFLAGVLLGLAGATWQPVALCLLAAAVVVLRGTEERRDAVRRLALGLAAPVVGLLGYLGVTGAWPEAFDSAVRFPFSGIQHLQRTPVEKVEAMANSVGNHFGVGGVVVVIGLVGVVAAAVVAWRRGDRDDPLVAVALPATLVMLGYTAYDYQGYADLLPLVPFGCLGVAVAVVAARRVVARLVAGVAVVALAVTAVTVAASASGAELAQQRRSTCALDVLAGDGELLAIGDPTPLVLTGRTNDDRFVYIGSGIGTWRAERTPGGLAGWRQEVLDRRPRVVVVMGVEPQAAIPRFFQSGLRDAGYRKLFLGPWRVYLDRRAPLVPDVTATAEPTRRAVVDEAALRGCGLS